MATCVSNSHDFQLFLDLLELVELAFAAPRADFAGVLPRLFIADIGAPEGPSLALTGTSFVDGAFARLGVEQHTVVALGTFFQAAADANLTDILFLKSCGSHVQLSGQRVDLGLIDPDVTWRAGAAVAAASTFEAKAVLVPRLSLIHI